MEGPQKGEKRKQKHNIFLKRATNATSFPQFSPDFLGPAFYGWIRWLCVSLRPCQTGNLRGASNHDDFAGDSGVIGPGGEGCRLGLEQRLLPTNYQLDSVTR